MASTGAVWVYPSGGGNWGIYCDYNWNASTRQFSVSQIHGQRSNYRSNGNGTVTYQIWAGSQYLNGWANYVTMEFTKGAWSTGYWKHDYYNQAVTIPNNQNTVGIVVYTSSDAFNKFIKSTTWPTMIVNVGYGSYYLDLNGTLDGTAKGNIANYGTANVDVAGARRATGVTDYYTAWTYGSAYSVSVTPASGKAFSDGSTSAKTWSGTINGNVNVTPDLRTRYAVTYNANGGSGAPGTQYKLHGINLTLSSTKPTKSSTATRTITYNANGGNTPSKATDKSTQKTTYTFSTWNTNTSNTGTKYAAGATYSGNAALTLYAIWGSGTAGSWTTCTSATCTRNNSTATRTVTYNANGGNTPSATSQSSTATVTYSCKGWYTAASGGTKRCGTNQSYTPAATETLYAQWSSSTGSFKAITSPTCTRANGTATRKVTFNANGGSCSTASLNSTAPITYSCNGWYTATSGGTKRCAANASYTPSATETLYAQWGSTTGSFSAVTLPTATKTNGSTSCTITYNANGGSCSTTSATSSATITYTQTGWWTATSGGTNRGKPGAKYTPSAAETVYAQFSSSQGAYSAVTLPTPTRAGYKFKGWSTSSTATSGSTGSYTPTGNVTLYATWELAQANMNIKVSGVWKKGPAFVKVGGAWKSITKVYVKVNGAWKETN